MNVPTIGMNKQNGIDYQVKVLFADGKFTTAPHPLPPKNSNKIIIEGLKCNIILFHKICVNTVKNQALQGV
jgi:hypothetical protein